ncbi:hypothetical protein V3C99_004278 [Haemonchus contortus]
MLNQLFRGCHFTNFQLHCTHWIIDYVGALCILFWIVMYVGIQYFGWFGVRTGKPFERVRVVRKRKKRSKTPKKSVSEKKK